MHKGHGCKDVELIIIYDATLGASGVVPALGQVGTVSRADHASTSSPHRLPPRQKLPMPRADDLLAAIEAADAAKCLQLLSDQDEKQRRELSQKEAFERYLVGRVALLGVATFTELKRLRSWSFATFDRAAVSVLVNRRP